MKLTTLLIILFLCSGCSLKKYQGKAWEEEGVLHFELNQRGAIKAEKTKEGWKGEVDFRDKSLLRTIGEAYATKAMGKVK